MRLLVILALLWPGLVFGQSEQVDPADLQLEILVEDLPDPLYVGEMVMITIRGTYRRHITREALQQPDLTGFNWSQLGTDLWREERIDGKKVKVMERRMALYPTIPGRLSIAPFRHDLTLTDAGDDWFEHQIASAPVEIEVSGIPDAAAAGWWFPVRRLEISDEWSNAPDRLEPGDGVLRVIRIEALGATPEMIPPMPDLTSPSARIFAHPEKRLVELTPYGPVTHAFWRWTVRPSNNTSTILEPIELPYFDASARRMAKATITPQRVAYLAEDTLRASEPPRAARLPGWPVAGLGIGAFLLGAGLLFQGRRYAGLSRLTLFDRDLRALRRAGRHKDRAGLRQAMRALLRRRPQPSAHRHLEALDAAVFAPRRQDPDLRALSRDFAKAWRSSR